MASPQSRCARRGVPPAHREDLETLSHGVFDEAAPGGQVHYVVLVDLRRDDDHRPVSDHGGGRRVLEELADLVAVDDGSGGHGQVPTHLVGPGGDRAGQSPVVEDIPADVAKAPPYAPSGRLPRPLEGFGVEREVVGRSQGRGEEADGEAGPLLGAPVQAGVVDQLEQGVRPGQVGLGQSPVGRVLLPRSVLEAPVARLGRHLRAAEGDAAPLLGQLAETPWSSSGGHPSPDPGHGAEQAEHIEGTDKLPASDNRLDLVRCHRARHGRLHPRCLFPFVGD